MALCAGGGEICRDVIRVRRALEILHVAGHTRRAGQVVVVVRMAVTHCRGGTAWELVRGKPTVSDRTSH